MVRITEEILKKMVEMRKAGATYRTIEQALGVSRWACIRYLRNVKPEPSAIEKAWKKAEADAIRFLKKKGFSDIHNLNRICPSPHWDFLARKKRQWWLIDVTISERKKIGAKIPYFVDGYEHAILYRNLNDGSWRLVRLSYEQV